MALLHYENLTDHRPDMLMRMTFDGLQNFFKFLNTTKQYLVSEKAVKRLSWEPANRERADNAQNGVWIQLTEPKGVFENFESNFKLFLDESNKEVYETSIGNWANIGAMAQECTQCKQSNGKPKMAFQSEAHAIQVTENSTVELSVYECPNGQGWHLTQELSSSVNFSSNNKITILDRDPEREQLLLERSPNESLLVLRPNTYQIMCQIRAIQALQNSPSKIHRPLLRLFEASDHARWPDVGSQFFFGESNFDDPVTHWYVLTDNQRLGTDEQRKWVTVALNTPDFAFLVGPPGSGKTTAICELVIQLALRGKRILLCASTHVAVDNVLERLMDEENTHRDCILPIRIGDSSSVSPKAKPWQLEEFIRTERTRLMSFLRDTGELSKAQNELFEQLRGGRETVQKMVLESANLVCGTTIGILQHPDIKNRGEQSPQFDLMIIDEASKTTFQEFLVPALLAKRWVLVGDPKQLSPYVDDESTAVNIEPCLPEKYKREACVDVFQASIPNFKQRVSSIVCSDNKNTIEFYENQSAFASVLVGTQNTEHELLPFSGLVVGNSNFLNHNQDNLPLDIGKVRCPEAVPDAIKRKSEAFRRLAKNVGNKLEPSTWEGEISWRLARLYDQRLNDEIITDDTSSKKRSTSEKLNEQIKQLLPYDDKNYKSTVWEQVDRVRRVALPSVLESLQAGFERNAHQRAGTALSDGLPENVLSQRSVALTWQHRMHPDIAEFSHQYIYQEEALFTPEFLTGKRHWSYRSDSKRCVWHDIKGRKKSSNANKAEVDEMMIELKAFDEWARGNPNIDSNSGRKKPWEVALLTFYRGQERELRKALRQWTKNHSGFRHFHRGDNNNAYLDIHVCTVDRFQGHEADMVLLSFSSPFATSFLESPNRLNVAITRARYQLIVYGNRNGMKKASGTLSQFANYVPWDKSLRSDSSMGDK